MGYQYVYQPVNSSGTNYQEQWEQSMQTAGPPGDPTLFSRPGHTDSWSNLLWGRKKPDAHCERVGVGPDQMSWYERGDGHYRHSGAVPRNWTPSTGGPGEGRVKGRESPWEWDRLPKRVITN